MNPIRLAASTLLLSLTTSTTFADGGTLQFVGAIVEAGCTVTAVPDSTGTPTPYELQVDHRNDACAKNFPAFTSQLAPVNTRENRDGEAVITLTYN